jgi:hypothetical protein
MVLRDNIPQQPFFPWLIKNRETRILLIISGLIVIVVYAWFKLIYPLPNFFPDSYEYIFAAIKKKSIGIRPIGYTKFLQWLPFITRSHFWLISTQFILIQGSLLYLLFSIRYLLQPGKVVFIILLFGCILNPLLYHVSNFVSSDPLFTTLSLIWFTELLWIIARPTKSLLISHAIILFLAFTMRYNALYYPIISIGIILYSQAPRWLKGVSMALIAFSLGCFVLYTKQQFKKQTSIAQFSPFSGWQQAANALSVYTNAITLYSLERVPEQFKPLHKIVNEYMDLLHRTPHNPAIESVTYYMWDLESPLWRYMYQQTNKDTVSTNFIRWAKMAPLYNSYGNYLIKQHVNLYLKHHIVSDTKQYFNPYVEYLGEYVIGDKKIFPAGALWFKIPINSFETRTDFKISITKYMATLHGVFSLLFILAASLFIGKAGLKNTPPSSRKILACALLVLLCNGGFSIVAAPIVLRYQTFPFILTSVFSVLLAEYLIRTYLLHKLKKTITNKEPISTEPGFI